MIDWEYSRTARKHWAYNRDVSIYSDGYCYLFEIINLTQDNHYNQRKGEGYDLLHKGVKVAHAKTVKELKLKAESLL